MNNPSQRRSHQYKDCFLSLFCVFFTHNNHAKEVRSRPAKTLMLEVKKEIGAVDDEYSSMAETLGDVLALARKRRDEEKNDKKE